MMGATNSGLAMAPVAVAPITNNAAFNALEIFMIVLRAEDNPFLLSMFWFSWREITIREIAKLLFRSFSILTSKSEKYLKSES